MEKLLDGSNLMKGGDLQSASFDKQLNFRMEDKRGKQGDLLQYVNVKLLVHVLSKEGDK
jgi:hypothetical protein